ncbi:MAG TPA: hypothetical protein VFW33_22010 [Gemmataceae bacterium]|nr:hypothetical protein [Gemmataceae bacterium]
MHPRGRSGRRWRVAGVLTTALAFSLASCGTLLYPERRGQPAGRLDVGVVALDGIGLLLFLVPGVIAFAVDFATGAIYLPPACAALAPPAATDLRQVRIDPAGLTPRRLEEVVREQTGRDVSLRPGAYRAARLPALDDFTPDAVAHLQAAPQADRVIFRASRE